MFKISDDNSMEIVRGDSGGFEFSINETDAEGGISPYVLGEGDVLTFTVKKSTTDSTHIIQKIGMPVSDSAVAFSIEPEDTAELRYGRYFYDIEFRRNDGYVDTLIRPTLFVIGEEVTF